MTRILRSAGVVATSVCACVLTCLLLDRVLPTRDLPLYVREKMAHLAAHANEYDVLFIGSSRVQTGIMPAIFDRDMAARGQAIRSFNFGVSGMFPPQDAQVLDQILQLKPARLRWVFVELQTLEVAIPRADRDTLQQLSWHDWPRFSLLCERFITAREHSRWRDRLGEVSSRWPDFCDHALLFVRNFTSIGRGSTLLNRWLFNEEEPRPVWSVLGKNGDGWLAVHRLMRGQGAAALEEEFATRRRIPPIRDSADPVSRKALALMIAKIQRAGATPVLIVLPTPNESYFSPDPQSASHCVILNFANPKKYPELYQPEYRGDRLHLNAAGAEIFTHLLAEQFFQAARERDTMLFSVFESIPPAVARADR